MIVWLDAHLSPRTARWLRERFEVDAVAVSSSPLAAAEDLVIWQAARQANAILVTKDADFAELAHRLGPPPQVIWLTCGNTSNAALCALLERHWLAVLDALSRGEPLIEISD